MTDTNNITVPLNKLDHDPGTCARPTRRQKSRKWPLP